MTLTKRQAIRECKKVWRPVLEGKAKNKREALELLPAFWSYASACPFCQYVSDTYKDKDTHFCLRCPLIEQTGWRCDEPMIDYIKHPDLFASVIMALRD